MEAKITRLNSINEIALHLINKLNYLLNVKKGNVNIAISGGNTPKAIFENWNANFVEKIDWTRISFFWVDERCVSPNSDESNYGVAKRMFLDKVLSNQTNVFPIMGDNSIDDELSRLNSLVYNLIPIKNNLPSFDLILLGLGNDGHTASIFPGQLNLFNSDTAYLSSVNPLSGQQRITLSGNTINNASEVCFIVTGHDKNKILDSIFNKKDNWELYPASHIINSSLEWIIEK